MIVYDKESQQPERVVQCKAWNVYHVKLKEVRELLGAVVAHKVKQGIFITTATYTDGADKFAKENDMVLIDGKTFLNKIIELGEEPAKKLLEKATSGKYWIPSCPKCGVKMVERRNKINRNKFWGCPRYPAGCRGKLAMQNSKSK